MYAFEMSKVDPEAEREKVRQAIAGLVSVRKKYGLSQYRVSQLAGISREAVRKIESGDRVPSLHTFLLLCSALQTDPAKLLK